MTDETTDIPNTSLRAAVEGYSVGFKNGPRPQEPSYWELNNKLIREAFVRLNNVHETTIDKHEYSRNGSFRQGTTVYYDPRDSGPYTDGADALADVPDGGTFRLAAADYDVPTEGRLVHEEAINIEGEGWNTSGPPNHEGTRLLNTGAGALDKPVIEFRTGNRGRYEGAEIHSLLIEHEGAGSAIVVDDHPRTEINHLNIVGSGPATVGIEMKGGSYASRIQFCNTANFNRAGYLTSTTGSRVEYWGCYCFTNVTGSSCFEVHDQNTMILGGESRAKNGSDGIVFIGDEGSNGGLVLNHLFEDCEVGVKFTDVDFRDTDIWFPHVAYGAAGSAGVNTLVEFDTATNCRLWFPQVRRANTGGTLAHFGPNAGRCGVVHAGGISRFLNVDVDPAATDCYQMIKAAVPHSHIGDLPTDPNLVWQVDYDIGKNSPAWHDGNRWWYAIPTASFIGPITTNYTAEHGDTVFADTDAANVTVTLPPAAEGFRVTTANYQSSGSGDLFVETADPALLNGQSSVTIGSQGAIYEWFCDGTDWFAA